MMWLTKIGMIANVFADFMDLITRVIYEGIYKLVSFFYVLLDLIQAVFRKFAGIDPMYTGSGNGEYDIVTSLLTTDVIRNAMLSVLLLAAILLIMFTIFAIVKQQYAVQPEPIGTVIGRSIRALFGFLFIPILCVTGVYLGNIVLKAIDGATAAGNGKTMSSRIFATTSYEANFLRSGDISVENKLSLIKYYAQSSFVNLMPELEQYGSPTEADIEVVADIIDNGFENRFPNAPAGAVASENDDNASFYQPPHRWRAALYHHYSAESGTSVAIERMPYRDLGLVQAFYDISLINYLFMIVAIFFTGYSLCIMAFGVINRIFNLTILYCISPALLALYPLDNGSAIGAWKKDFISNAIIAYAAVGIFNLFLQVLELVDYIKPFATANLTRIINPTTLSSTNMMLSGGFMNSIVQLIVMICGCFMVNGLIGKVSGYIGGGDAMSEGKSTSGNASKAIKSGVGTAVSTFSSGVENAKYGKSAAGKVGKFFTGIGGSILDKMGTSNFRDAAKKGVDSVDSKRKQKGEVTFSSDPEVRKREQEAFRQAQTSWAKNQANEETRIEAIGTGKDRHYNHNELMKNSQLRPFVKDAVLAVQGEEITNQKLADERAKMREVEKKLIQANTLLGDDGYNFTTATGQKAYRAMTMDASEFSKLATGTTVQQAEFKELMDARAEAIEIINRARQADARKNIKNRKITDKAVLMSLGEMDKLGNPLNSGLQSLMNKRDEILAVEKAKSDNTLKKAVGDLTSFTDSAIKVIEKGLDATKGMSIENKEVIQKGIKKAGEKKES